MGPRNFLFDYHINCTAPFDFRVSLPLLFGFLSRSASCLSILLWIFLHFLNCDRDTFLFRGRHRTCLLKQFFSYFFYSETPLSFLMFFFLQGASFWWSTLLSTWSNLILTLFSSAKKRVWTLGELLSAECQGHPLLMTPPLTWLFPDSLPSFCDLLLRS